MPALTLFLFLLTAFFSGGEPPCPEVSLRKSTSFPIGVAVNTTKLRDEERYWTTAMAQFNSFTPEKILKPQFIHPRKDEFNFFEPDHLMAFCREQKMRLHGHALVWHEAVPAWMEEFRGDAAAWDELLRNHVQTIVSHCKGTIRSWDVVNEAFDDQGGLRRNIWLKNIGESYIEKAYLYAAQADPTALLFYNDYSLERNGAKLDAVLKFFAALKQKGVSIHGIGMQMHVSLTFPAIADINAAALRIEKEGLLVHYSELDVNLAGEGTFMVGRKKLEAEQRDRYREIVRGYLQLKPASRFGITLWGVSDNDSWLTDQRVRSRPLLFSNRYRIKPAFCGFAEALSP
jgi:endo-1,4-beta-xylanase